MDTNLLHKRRDNKQCANFITGSESQQIIWWMLVSTKLADMLLNSILFQSYDNKEINIQSKNYTYVYMLILIFKSSTRADDVM